MPTYAYTCPRCRHEFERFHKMNVKARPKCPECGAVAERQITGGAGFLFKGSGFYITDYKKADTADKADKAEKADKGEKREKAGKPEKAAESAPKSKKADAGPKGSDS